MAGGPDYRRKAGMSQMLLREATNKITNSLICCLLEEFWYILLRRQWVVGCESPRETTKSGSPSQISRAVIFYIL